MIATPDGENTQPHAENSPAFNLHIRRCHCGHGYSNYSNTLLRKLISFWREPACFHCRFIDDVLYKYNNNQNTKNMRK